jgi:probable HAF family extracellular repeat protein
LVINNNGQIVGYYYDGKSDHGFIYDKGTLITLDPPGASYTIANGINASSAVVGYYNDSTGLQHGFIYDDRSFTTLDIPGASYTTANGINNSGGVVGFYNDGKVHTAL